MSQSPLSRSIGIAALALLAALCLSRLSLAWEVAGEGEKPGEPRTAIGTPAEDAGSTSVRIEHQRVPVPSMSSEASHPYTIEVPVSWVVRRDLPALGVFLGPSSGDPNTHPEMLLMRESAVALDAPEAILTNIRANAAGADWSLIEAEVRDFGGIRGLWIVREMPPAGLHGSRVSFAVKLPLGDRSLDLMATLPAQERDALGPRIEYMLRSVRPAAAAAQTAPPEPQG